MTEFCGAGGKVPKKIWVPLGTKDYASFIAQIPKDVDAVYVALGGTDALNFTKQFDEFTGRKTPLLGGSITVDGAIIKGLKDRVEGTVSAGPVAVLDSPAYKEYAAALKKAFPEAGPPGLFDLGYYVNMKSLLQGLDKVGRRRLRRGREAARGALEPELGHPGRAGQARREPAGDLQQLPVQGDQRREQAARHRGEREPDARRRP